MLHARDILWKGVIEDLFADFLRFFYKDAEEKIDMQKGFQFLDKELAQLYPDANTRSPTFVDKLVNVYKKNGTNEWLLIHVEVQAYKDKLFARRMFTYFYRILDRFDREVASLAIYSGNDLSYCPDRYEYQSLETSNVFHFKTYQIKGQDVSELEKSDNPFAIVILTVFVFLQKKHKPQEELLQVSLSLARRLFRKGFSREKIDRLLTFLKTYVNFENPEMFAKFDSEIDVITNKKWTMGINELVIQLREEAATERSKAIFVRNLLLKTHHSIQEIAELADAPLDFVIEVKNKLPAA